MKFLIIPVERYENNVRLPAMWAECVWDVKEAEEIAKQLATKHAKEYTVLSVVSTFQPEYSVKKGK